MPPATFNKEIDKKYNELFEQFDFVNCAKNTTIIELVKSLLPESIPIRIHQAMLKKIVFINNQINNTSEKLDYSILITELFIAIAEEVKIKWNGTFLEFDHKRGGLIIKNTQVTNQYQHPKEITDFIMRIACVGIYKYAPAQNGEQKTWLDIYEEEATINSLVLYYIARLIGDRQLYPYSKISYLTKNDEYITKFFNYYKTLEM